MGHQKQGSLEVGWTNKLEGTDQVGRNLRVGTRVETGCAANRLIRNSSNISSETARSGSRMEMVTMSSSESNNSLASGSGFVAGFGFGSGSVTGVGSRGGKRLLLDP